MSGVVRWLAVAATSFTGCGDSPASPEVEVDAIVVADIGQIQPNAAVDAEALTAPDFGVPDAAPVPVDSEVDAGAAPDCTLHIAVEPQGPIVLRFRALGDEEEACGARGWAWLVERGPEGAQAIFHERLGPGSGTPEDGATQDVLTTREASLVARIEGAYVVRVVAYREDGESTATVQFEVPAIFDAHDARLPAR